MSTSNAQDDSQSRRFVDPDLFRDVIGHFASGVTVITARDQGADYGATASAVTSLSLEPPMLLICLNRKSVTQAAISHARAFAVNILAEDQGEIAAQMARPHQDKFRSLQVSYGELGEPLLTDVLAHLECRVAEEVQGGTHTIFLAEVQHADARAGTPLTYFRGKFGRFQDVGDEAVYRQIRQRVLHRDIQLGQLLNISDLAYELDVPRQAVYYALTKLSAERLVARNPEEENIAACIEERIPALSFYWGDPSPYVERVHAAGIKVIHQIGSVAAAQRSASAGVDVILLRALKQVVTSLGRSR